MKVTLKEIENYFLNCKFPKNFFLKSDEIKGKTVAIASKNKDVIEIHSNFMTLNEMKAYLFGRYDALYKKY